MLIYLDKLKPTRKKNIIRQASGSNKSPPSRGISLTVPLSSGPVHVPSRNDFTRKFHRPVLGLPSPNRFARADPILLVVRYAVRFFNARWSTASRRRPGSLANDRPGHYRSFASTHRCAFQACDPTPSLPVGPASSPPERPRVACYIVHFGRSSFTRRRPIKIFLMDNF